MFDLFSKFDEVVLGWLLGVLSTPLAMYCSAIIERRRFKNVLKEELREVLFRLAASIYILRLHLGQLDRTTLNWIAGELSIYPEGPELGFDVYGPGFGFSTSRQNTQTYLIGQ